MALEKSPLHPDNVKARFAELQKKKQEIQAVSIPLRTQRDKIANEARAQEQEFNKKILAAEVDLFDIDKEIALCARALGGRVGDIEGVAVGAEPQDTPA